MIKNKKAFTLIELIVTIAVLGILVLLAGPRFFGYTQNAELTKGFANAKSIEKASELYYMDHEDWPRLTDEPYTSEEIESYSERIFDRTGQEVNLDPEGNYYDIDYDKLSDYIQVPDDKKSYILQNPVGKVFYMDNLNETGIARVNYSSAKEELRNPIGIRKPIEGEIAIDSAEELAKIGQTGYPLSGKYILTSNIDLSKNENWDPIGNNDSRFTGSFDGNGYKIINLTIDKPSQNYVGLFGYTDRAIINNVALEDIKVTGTATYVGSLVGYAYASKIENSYVTGLVTGSGSQVGGLVGGAYYSSTIKNSYVTGTVTGGDYVGGLVGNAGDSNIRNSYTTGPVTGKSYVGGLVGRSYRSTIENSYATGSVTGSGQYVRELVGLVVP